MKELISDCWDGNHDKRSSFDEIFTCISNDMSILGEYVDEDEVNDYCYILNDSCSRKEDIKNDKKKIDEKLSKTTETLRLLISAIENKPVEKIDIDNLTKDKIHSLCDEASKSKLIANAVNNHLLESKNNVEEIDRELSNLVENKNDFSQAQKSLCQLVSKIEDIPINKIKPEDLNEEMILSLCNKISKSKSIINVVNRHLPESQNNVDAIDATLTKLLKDSEELAKANKPLSEVSEKQPKKEETAELPGAKLSPPKNDQALTNNPKGLTFKEKLLLAQQQKQQVDQDQPDLSTKSSLTKKEQEPTSNSKGLTIKERLRLQQEQQKQQQKQQADQDQPIILTKPSPTKKEQEPTNNSKGLSFKEKLLLAQQQRQLQEEEEEEK